MKFKSILVLLVILSVSLTVFLSIQEWQSNNIKNVKLVINSNISSDSINSLISSNLGIKTYPSFAWLAKQQKVDFNKKIVISVKPNTNVWNLLKMVKNYKATSFDWVLRSSGTLPDVFQDIILDYKKNTSNSKWQNNNLNFWFSTDSNYKVYGLTTQTAHCLFIANTYNLKSNYSPRDFLDRMYKESFGKFWNNQRKAAAQRNKISIIETIILASIVTKESNAIKEFGKIASVYKLRLKKGMRLEADPTVVYARGRAGRVLLSDTKINSPYNTYQVNGLPPGPLCIPDTKAIDSVLFGANYPFLFFCAKPDNSGTHNFAVTLSEHNKNAKNYHQWLNNRGIQK